MRPRAATTGIFFCNGAFVGTWVAQIPWVQERFSLSEAALGLVLMSMSLAVIAALPIGGQAVARQGSAPVVLAGGVACAVCVVLPVLAPAPGLVALGLLALGGSAAIMDVAMNSHGVAVEQELGRPIMSSLHAGWSLGGAAGAGFAALLLALGLDPRAATAIAAVALLVAVLVLVRRIGRGAIGGGDAAEGFSLPARGVVVLAVLCFLVMVCEGAMADWGGVFLRGDLGASTALAALAFTAFTAGMTLGRVVGDRVNARLGPVALLRGGGLLTAAALVATLLAPTAPVALAGLVLVGLGVANGVPLMFSAAGRHGDAPAIAAVSSMGSLGFLAGPPIIGLLAGVATLPWALATLVPGALAVVALARRAA